MKVEVDMKMDYPTLKESWRLMPTSLLVLMYSIVGLFCTASAESHMTSQPTPAQPILTNHSDGANILYTYTTPNSAKTVKKDDDEGILNLLNIPEGVNIDNLAKTSNGNVYTAEPSIPSEANYPTGLEAPHPVYKEIQRTTADGDTPIKDSTDSTSADVEKVNSTSQNERTTIMPYNLNDDDSDIGYEVDISEVELLKTTENPDDTNEVDGEDKRKKKKVPTATLR